MTGIAPEVGSSVLDQDPLAGPADLNADPGVPPIPGPPPSPFGDPITTQGPLLDLQPAQSGALAMKTWRSQENALRRLRAEWKANYLRRRGYNNVAVVRNTDGSWKCWHPPMAAPPIPTLNKAARLCRRLRGVLFADPWMAEVVPNRGDDESRDAAEFTQRALAEIQGADGCRTILNAGRAFDLGSIFASGFVYTRVDPYGAGRQPVRLFACPEAQSVEDALMYPSEPVIRFVTPQGTLTDQEGQAARQWQPGLREEVLTGRQVRLHPWTAKDVAEASAVQIGVYLPWGEIRRSWPDVAKLQPGDVRKLAAQRPQDTTDNMPNQWDGQSDSQQTDLLDPLMIFVLMTYVVADAEYPEGAYHVCLGNGTTLAHRQTWTATLDGKPVPLLIPVVQYKQWEEAAEDPYGVGLMTLLGGGNEIRAGQVAALIEFLDKFNNRKIFLPTNSILQPKQYQLMTHTVIPINPGGKPEYEEIPNFPREAFQLYETLGTEMDSTSGLEQAAQGVEDPSVQSGRHAMQIVAQVHAGLSDVNGRCEAAFLRQCRIHIQMAAAYFDRPRRLGWTGEDGDYKEEHWSGSDLVLDSQIRTKPGSGTMLAPSAKAELAERYAALGIIPPADLREMIASSLGGTIGLQDDPVRLRVRRQIARWEKGPPPGWQPAPPVLDPASGQMVSGPDPVVAKLWEATPADAMPDVAAVRLWELRKAMQSGKYLRQPPAWRMGMDTEFQRMWLASMPPAPPPAGNTEQAQAQHAVADRKAPGPDAQLAAQATGQAPPVPVSPAA